MRVPRLATALAALAAVLGGASSARADVKVPKALAGVELHEGATKVEIDKAVKRLGGRDVIVFRTSYKSETTADEKTYEDEGVELAIVDASTKQAFFRQPIKSSYKRYVYGEDEVTGSFEYRVSWKDYDEDGEKELVLSLGASSGRGAQSPATTRIWQVRLGMIAEVSAELAGCPRDPEDDGTLGGDWVVWSERRRVAVERFVEAVDMGARTRQVRCTYGNALVGSNWPVHDGLMPLGEILAAPVAVDCPGIDWAARRGSKIDPKRSYVLVAPDGLVVVRVETSVLKKLKVLEIGGDLAARMEAPRTTFPWSEMWIIDEHVYFIGEAELTWPDHSMARYAFVYDPLQQRIVQVSELATYQTARLEHRTTTHGEFELSVESTGKAVKTVWRVEAASWRQ